MSGISSLVWCGVMSSGVPAPVLTGLSSDLADTAAGDFITIFWDGTEAYVGANVTVGGVNAFVDEYSSGALTFVMPAMPPGTYELRITPVGGTPSNALSVEAWSPAQLPGIDGYLDSRKGVFIDGAGNVTSWVEQTRGAELTPTTTGPRRIESVFGLQPAIRFVQSTPLNEPGAARKLVNGTVAFWVGKWTSGDSSYNSYAGNNPLTVIGDTTGAVSSSRGAAGGSLEYTEFTSGWNRTARGAGLNDGQTRLVGWTHSATTNELKAYVGTTLQGPTALMTHSPNNGWNSIGGGRNDLGGYDGFEGDLGAVILVDGDISPSDLTKLHKWARAGFGALA